jgi:periplasmic protein CpxP/Spy
MKRKVVVGALLALTIGGAAAAWAEAGCDCTSPDMEHSGHGPRHAGPGLRGREHHGPSLDRIGEALRLSDAQQVKVAELIRAERGKNASLRQKLIENEKRLRQAGQAAKFDEAAVRSIAAQQAQLLSEQMVARARTQHQIFALLTPEQQARAEKFPPLGAMPAPFGPPGPGGPGGPGDLGGRPEHFGPGPEGRHHPEMPPEDEI